MLHSSGGVNISNFYSVNNNLDWIVSTSEKMDENDVELLRGEMAQGPSGGGRGMDSSTLDTLDEPISVTLLRDLKSIGFKIKHILFPVSHTEVSKHVFRDWDLWGPLLLCTMMALLLHHFNHETEYHSSGPQLSEVFALIWFGSSVLGFNFKMLAVNQNPRRTRSPSEPLIHPSIFQLLCVFGYCLAPPCIGLIVLLASQFLIFDEYLLIVLKVLVGTLLCFLWPTISCYRILNHYQDKSKIVLAMYPIALFYFVITWMIVTAH